MIDNSLLQIVDTSYTKSDFYNKSILLKSFFEHLFFTAQSGNSTIEKLNVYLVDNKVESDVIKSLSALNTDFYSYFTSENFNKILDDLEEYVKDLPSIVIYLPVIFTNSEIEKLGKWLRNNIAKNIFMEIKIDPEVVGGCSFVWNSVYHDFSHRYFFDKKHEDVVTMLRNYSDD